jgi:hypothetical protein
MSKYLQSKPGSIEELAAKMTSQVSESEYQQKFKKELEKAGKGIGAMTPAEKKAFFSKIDKQHKAKDEEIKEAVDNPYAVGMAQAMKKTGDKPPLKKSTITKAHDIAKSIEKDEKKEEVEEAKVDELTAAQKKLPPALQKAIKKKEDAKEEVEETHTFHKDKQNQKQKDAKGEKDIVDPDPKLKTESDAYDNDRFEIRNGIAYIDNKNTPDNKNHVYAPDKKTALQLFKQGKKVYREEANPSMNEETSKRFSLMKSIYDVWSNSATELEEVKKNAKYMKSSKDDVSTEVDAEQEKKEQDEKEKSLKIKLAKEKDTDALEKQLTAAQGKINLLQQKLENEKHKAIKPEPNPETGEVPLTVGVAYKIMKDKMKKESEEQKKNKTMTDKPKTPVDTKPSVDYKH